ncbi:DNA-directed RNA polymerase I subunit RPA34-like isoform X2 [Littorina saxatilis]|uniref:DNA-directed RNA polymerase I subunit RPA34-like isoform X2 n=1 Tax=Littorina saxatilis TaxID=31220 RepID=UPI0038B58A89
MAKNAPDNFVSMTTNDLKPHNEDDSNGTELWLVQVPQGFDVTALSKHVDTGILTGNGSQTIKVKTNQQKQYFSVHSYRDSADCKKLSEVVHDVSGQVCLGQDLQNMLVVSEVFKRSHHATGDTMTTPTARKPVPMPSGLKVRFTTFGSDAPVQSVSQTPKKEKRRSSTKEEVHSSPKKKHKKELPMEEVNGVPLYESHDHSPHASPHKKKHKRNASVEEENTARLSVSQHLSQEASPRKKKGKESRVSSTVSGPSQDSVIAANKVQQISPAKSIKREFNSSFVNDGETPTDSSSSSSKKKHKKSRRTCSTVSEPLQVSLHTDIEILPQITPKKSTKRKWDSTFADEDETTADSLSSPKKKKIKPSHSDSGVFVNGDGGDVSASVEKSPHKSEHHRRIKSEEVTQSSLLRDTLFMVDRGGHWAHTAKDSSEDFVDSSKKHKKKKKSKKVKKERLSS